MNKYEIRQIQLLFDKRFLYIIQNPTVVINTHTHLYCIMHLNITIILTSNKLQRVSSVHKISKVYWKRFLYFAYSVHCEQFAMYTISNSENNIAYLL